MSHKGQLLETLTLSDSPLMNSHFPSFSIPTLLPMDDDTKPLQSHSARSSTTAQTPPNPPPADDPPPPENPEHDDHPPETARESKRRRLCPAALEKCGEALARNNSACFSNSSNGFSFSFDPKFSFGVSTPEVTPKFGSFKLLPVEGGADASNLENEDGKKEEKELVKDGDGEDGIGISTEDYLEEGSNLLL